MCLIIAKPKKINIPEYVISSAIERNSDGWGILYYDGTQVQAIKYLNLDIIQARKELDSQISRLGNKYNLYIHLRMATGGSISLENTHPFKLGNSGVWMLHNGVMSIAPTKDKSDTAQFAEMISPILECNLNIIYESYFDDIVNYYANGDRLLFMLPNGEVIIKGTGKWRNEKGVILSNRYSWDKTYISRKKSNKNNKNNISTTLEEALKEEPIEDSPKQYSLTELMEMPDAELEYLAWDNPDILIRAIQEYRINNNNNSDKLSELLADL